LSRWAIWWRGGGVQRSITISLIGDRGRDTPSIVRGLRARRLARRRARHRHRRPGIIQLPTGAWYDPMDPEEETPLCVHGNPNVLTRDVGTSSFVQGCTGQITTVQVERFNGNLPPIRAFDPV
jgi:hypothetical protein